VGEYSWVENGQTKKDEKDQFDLLHPHCVHDVEKLNQLHFMSTKKTVVVLMRSAQNAIKITAENDTVPKQCWKSVLLKRPIMELRHSNIWNYMKNNRENVPFAINRQ